MPLLPESSTPNLLEGLEFSEDAQYLLATKVNSEYFRRRFSAGIARWQAKPAQANGRPKYKSYAHTDKVPLKPDLHPFQNLNLERAILERKSARHFNGQPVTFEQLSNILLLTQGMKENGHWLTNDVEVAAAQSPRRALPSGGGLYPLEFYVWARAVDSLASGLYHFDVSHQALSRIRKSEDIPPLGEILAQEDLFDNPSVVFFVTSVFERSRIKYGPRSLRFILLEAGGVGVQAQIIANAMGLDFCFDGGGFENRIENLIGIDGYQEGLVAQFMMGHTGTL